ncbi:MAG: NAD(P)-binding protein [Hyphomicrobiales bacterium]|nr:NAD(P)-binding protein [Hyphomicrobiales bacterium]MDE2115015.1 NAD(P)-binding protein [Hyphomicrobiales bacterium]
MALETDYLVIGAGMTGLAFVDELINHSDAHITVVDKRDAPGGHWNDVYSFVNLHQPSVFYGVGSTELADYRIDTAGPNKGFLSLAKGPEITAYCHAIMRDRLLPSGQVTYLPFTEFEPQGALHSLLSGARETIKVRKKVVNAAHYTNVIPLTHTRKFKVDSNVTCVPPNDLPRLATHFSHFTVLGAGKTAMDACLWLLTHGAPASAIRWIIPRDAWFVNRAKTQPGPEFFDEVFGNFADQRQDLADATSARDLAHRHEASGTWLRLDRAIEPTMFHAAAMSEGELEKLRTISDQVRLGRVHHITSSAIYLERGEVPAVLGNLMIDCTASAVLPKPLQPVFAGDQITIQLLRFPFLPLSAAMIAFLEARFMDDDEKNKHSTPIPIPDTVEDYLRILKPDMDNRLHIARSPILREWMSLSRLDGYSRIAAKVDKGDLKKLAILHRGREANKTAYANLQNLLAALPV